jgi:hypothetical protein
MIDEVTRSFGDRRAFLNGAWLTHVQVAQLRTPARNVTRAVAFLGIGWAVSIQLLGTEQPDYFALVAPSARYSATLSSWVVLARGLPVSARSLVKRQSNGREADCSNTPQGAGSSRRAIAVATGPRSSRNFEANAEKEWTPEFGHV